MVLVMAQRRPANYSLFSTIICHFISFSLAVFGSKKKREQEEEEARRAEEERLAELVDKMMFYILTSLLAVALAIAVSQGGNRKIGNKPNDDNTVDIIVVGCGLPKKGMGWYHLTQLLDMPNVNVRGVVEPFFMDRKLCKKPPETWKNLVKSLKSSGVQVVASVGDLSGFNSKKKTMCLIAGRTLDNPALFSQCIDKGVNVIYLEKPGAPSVDELEKMKNTAEEHGVKVYIGYNKNVTPYTRKAIALAKETPNSRITFVHNNSYNERDLPEVFSRNSEGMLKNMAIHELALLVTFFGVSVNTIKEFHVNSSKLFSEKLSIWKPGSSMSNPEYITDFSRIAFSVTTVDGTNVSVMADRCGGNVSFSLVKDSEGHELKKFEFPDPSKASEIEQKILSDPEMMPYFHIQSDDYLELKNRVVSSALDNKVAEGVASIEVGVEALKLAEYATQQISQALKKV